MGRLPFDPSRMAKPRVTSPSIPRGGSGAQGGGGGDGRISVSQLAALIDRAVRDNLPSGLRVVGEVGQFTDRTHWYFQLKDAGAAVSCVMFSSAARRAGFTPQTGVQVVATGRVEFYAPQGRTQFMVDKLEPIGAGALDLEFRRLCDELRSRGYFEPARKRVLPLVPRRIAVITSRTGAALQDVLDTARRRCPSVDIALVDVRVQGEGAAAQVTRAIQQLARANTRLGIDVILVTRGGGSMEDLWAFNDRALADAIFTSPIPIVAAIGHETDTTIAELVADLRGATPTQAAMAIFPDSRALRRQLHSLGVRLGSPLARELRVLAGTLALRRRELLGCLRERINTDSHRVERAAARLERHRPAAVYAKRESSLRAAERRLASAIVVRVNAVSAPTLRRRLDDAWAIARERRVAALASAARGLDLVGPINVLHRGYSMTFTPDGHVVRSRSMVRDGDRVTTRVADGAFTSVVRGANAASGAELAGITATIGSGQSQRSARSAAAVQSPSPRRVRARVDPSQLGLFTTPEPGGTVTP